MRAVRPIDRVAAFALVLAVVGGCDDAKSADVHLTVSISNEVSNAQLASIKTLAITASGAHAELIGKSYTLDRAAHREESVLVHLSKGQMHVSFAGVARDGDGRVVAVGYASSSLASNPATVDLTLGRELGDMGALPDDAGGVVAVDPAELWLFTGQTAALQARGQVAWNVQETAGGTVDVAGNYRAPNTPGDYHVTATSSLFYGESASVLVHVLASGVIPYAGQPGGAGYLDGPRGATRINQPNGVATVGNSFYFVNGQENVVRKLDLDNGLVTPVAGRLCSIASVDGPPGTGTLGNATGLAADADGNLYVSDRFLVRKMTPDGTLTTLAGGGTGSNQDGPGASVRFGYLSSIAFEPHGNALYVTDTGNCSLRRIDLPGGAVTTVAGPAPVDGPADCREADGAGHAARFSNLHDIGCLRDACYVEELGGPPTKIRRFDVPTAAVTTIAQDDGSYSDLFVDGSHVYLSKGILLQLQANNLFTALPNPSGGGAAYWFGAVRGAPAPTGNTLLVATNWSIVSVDPTSGAVSEPLAGMTPDFSLAWGPLARIRFNWYGSMALAPNGKLYVAAGDNDGIIDTAAGSGDVDATFTQLQANMGGWPAFISDGRWVYAKGWDGTIRRGDLASGASVILAGSPNQWGWVDQPGASARFSGGVGNVAVVGGTVYVADGGNGAVRTIGSDGKVGTLAGGPGKGPLQGPRNVISDGAGALYVADLAAIYKVDIASGAVTLLAGGNEVGFADGDPTVARFNQPFGLALDRGQQSLYVADWGNSAIRQIRFPMNKVSTVAGHPGEEKVVLGALPGGLNMPSDLVMLADGTLLASIPNEKMIVAIRLP